MPGKSICMRNMILAAALFFVSMSLVLLTGCGSDKLTDQSDKQMGAIVESIQSGFAEDGWTYKSFEVIETDEENDTATVVITYDVEGNAKKLLQKNTSEKPKDTSIYKRAEDINVKATVELSAYDKANDALGCELKSTEWFVGDTEANAWIKEQNKKQ